MRTKSKIKKSRKLKPENIPEQVSRKLGRYTALVGEKICELVANGMPLVNICEMPGMPSLSLVISWVRNPDEERRPGFAKLYAEAEEIGLTVMQHQIIAIADDDSKDFIKKKVQTRLGGIVEIEVENAMKLARDKVKLETRKFMLSKLRPTVFGDKVQHEVNVTHILADRLEAARRRLAESSDVIITVDAKSPPEIAA